MTSTQTLESPTTSDADTGNEMFHYVRKAKITESAVTGTLVQALCGEVFPGHQGTQARLAGVPAVQGDLRVDAHLISAGRPDSGPVSAARSAGRAGSSTAAAAGPGARAVAPVTPPRWRR